MAITLDAVLGSTNTNVGSSASFNTTSAVAAGATVIVTYSWWDSNGPATTCTIGGSSATNDHQLNNASNDRVAIFSLKFAAGLATNSTITVTAQTGAAVGGQLVAATSYLGVGTVDKSGDVTATTAGAWAGASLSPAVADSLFVCVAGTDGTQASQSNTPNVGNERADQFNAATNQGAIMQDLIVTSTAANAISGTWGTTTGLSVQTIGTVIYSAASGRLVTRSFIPMMAPQGGVL